MSDTTSEQRSRRREQRGWYFYDWANSSFYTSAITVFGALYMTAVAEADARGNHALNGPSPCMSDGSSNTLVHCDITLFGLHFPAGSLWGYLLAAATILQVLLLPIVGAIADRARHKKRILGSTAAVGATATSLLVLVSGTNWELGLALYVVATVGWAASVIVYYSFLQDIAVPDERDTVSTRGWAIGYLGGGLALALQLAFYLSRDTFGVGEAGAVRICLLATGIWWAVFTIIPLRILGDHQPAASNSHHGSVLTQGFRELAATLRSAKSLPLTLGFLGAYLIYADGIATVVGVSAQYGKEELLFSTDVLITTILVIQFVAYVGATVVGTLARRFGAKRTILGTLVVWTLVLVSAYFVEAQQQFQFYALAAGIGLVLGGTPALSRSLYSQMIPAGKEAQYYSLYKISERGTAWLGPFLFGAVGQATGSFRYAIIALVVFFVAGFVLLSFLPVRRAIQAAGNPEPSVV